MYQLVVALLLAPANSDQAVAGTLLRGAASVQESGHSEATYRFENRVHQLRRGQQLSSLMQPSPLDFSLSAAAPAPAPFLSPAMLEAPVVPGKRGDPTLVRPNAGREADQIHFGLFVKNFYGDDLKDFTFQVDVVMSFEWKDLRVVDFIPPGLDNVTVDSEVASKSIWMPDIVVSNRDIDKYEITSSSVTLFRSGDVHKVERVHVRICEKFALIDYPFDTEHLRIVIASSTYMLDDLVLVPSTRTKISGVGCLVGGYNVEGFTTSAFEELDGNLKKSRGNLNIAAVRNLEKYRQDHLVPTAIILTISCAVFYFPMVGPFVTPRLALSILALLTFTNLMVKSTDALPGPAPYNWNDLLNQQIQGLMFLVIVINIFGEICWHTLGVEWIAKRVNKDAKVFIPCFSLFDVSFVTIVGYYRLLTLHTATIVIQSISFTLVACFVAWVTVMLVAEKKRNKAGSARLTPRMSVYDIAAVASV